MANRNPWKARLARAERRQPGDIDAVRRKTWALLCEAFTDCGVEDADQRRKAVLAYATVAGFYLKIIEQAEMLPRLEALEEAVRHDKAQHR